MENIHHEEEGYFSLIERVGSKGRYQRQLFLLFYTIWFITAFIILSMPFMFISPNYTCPDIYQKDQCRNWVCSLPTTQQKKYQESSGVISIINQLEGCHEESDIVNYKMGLFLGILVGYVIFSYFSDNFGRRKAMVFSWASTLLGLIFLCFSNSLIVVAIGLFLTGAGCESNLRVNLAIINEIVDYHLRQIYSIILQSAFGVAGILIAGSYYLMQDWRLVTISFCLIPAVIVMILIILKIEQTPTHLSSRGSKEVLLSLKRIAAINGLQCIITEQQVLQAIKIKTQSDRIKASSYRKLTFLDLFHFKSLKKNTIYLSLLLFFLASLYIGPNSILQSFNVDIFWFQIVLSLPDCIVYPLTCHCIVNIERRKAGLRSLGLCSAFLFVAIFLNASAECNLCFEMVVKLLLLFISRCFVSFYYGVLFLYIIQIYPEQIRSIGFGTVSVFGALGSTLVQKILSYSKKQNHNPFIYFFIFSLMCFFASFKLPETHGQNLQLQIEQLRKKRTNKKYQPSFEESFADLQLSSESAQSQRKANIQQN